MIEISSSTRILGVLGKNIDYSLSPYIHNFWYKQEGLDKVYLRFEALQDNFHTIVKSLFDAGIQGLNITVPFKEDAYNMCDVLTQEARLAQSVNCISLFPDKRLVGHNTDGQGFLSALRILLNKETIENLNFLIIGAGGAASGIVEMLSYYPVSINLLNRTYERAKIIEEKYQNRSTAHIQAVSKAQEVDIIIQTTNYKEEISNTIMDIPKNIVNNCKIVVDINYGQPKNFFLEQFTAKNIIKSDGLEMLLQQAALAFNFFNNKHHIVVNSEIREYTKGKLG